ncbi:MAG: hypothetical protein IH820_01700, partial [Bacteroidetes bacterium]|nr:hypothetical protein [Bacteroidota bacterium]
MARTITEAFNTFRSNLEISGLQQTTVSTRQQNVRSAMENGLKVVDSFLTGSYSRHTLIAPLKQAYIDILVLLDPSYFHHYNGQNGGQAGLLDKVKRVLRGTYPRTPDIGRNGQAVTIQFSDFIVDVVAGGVEAGRDRRDRDHRHLGGGRRRGRLSAALVAAEIALCLVALGGGGILLRTFQSLRQQDPGFEANNLLSVEFVVPLWKFPTAAERLMLMNQIE